jgi:FixJ family two-component response regulator
MPEQSRPRILVVDDEEAILETMTFTFEDDYEVLTSKSASEALALLDESGPVAVVISDQRMPEMTGVDFLAKVFERHPEAVRIILTGFADMDAIIAAINDGHVYAYITKPWEPDDLKQVVKRAVDHYHLAAENERLMTDLRDSNVFLEAVMDELDTGAIALDAAGVVRAANRPAREYLGLAGDPRGRLFKEMLGQTVLDRVAAAAIRIQSDDDVRYEEVELPVGAGVRLRVGVHELVGPGGRQLGSVILAREISHEPLRRRFEEVVDRITEAEGELRPVLEKAQEELRELSTEVGESNVSSPGMSELSDRVSRTRTAIEYWLAVDDSLASEDYPEAQPLMDRMRVAISRWPIPDRLPERVRELARRLESYYETGENPKQRVL